MYFLTSFLVDSSDFPKPALTIFAFEMAMPYTFCEVGAKYLSIT